MLRILGIVSIFYFIVGNCAARRINSQAAQQLAKNHEVILFTWRIVSTWRIPMNHKNKNSSLEDQLFLAGIWCFLLGCIALLWYLRFFVPRMPFAGCMFHAVTGFYCPGCGGTRAVLALLHGDLVQSFRYHPVVPYGVGLYVLFMGSHLLERLHVPHIKGIRFHGWYLYAALFIIIVHVLYINVIGVSW